MGFIKQNISMMEITCKKMGGIYKSIFFQCLLFNIMYFLNSYMMGQIDEYAVSAIGVGSQLLWVLQCIVQSSASAVGLLISRMWGKKDIGQIREFVVSTMIVVIAEFCVVLSVVYIYMGEIVNFYTENELIANRVKEYLLWAIWELLFSGIAMVYESVLQNTDQNKAVSKSYILELFMNIITLVFLVKIINMDVSGVAVASLITKAVKCVYMKRKYKFGYRISGRKILSSSKRIVNISIPILIETLLWNAGSTLVMGRVGQLTLTDVAIYSVFNSSLYVLFVPIEAFTKAAKVYIGQLFGNSKSDYIKNKVNNLLCINQLIIMGTLIATVVFWNNIKLFYSSLSGDAIDTANQLVGLIVIYIILKGENELISNGILRTGLDNSFKCFIEVLVLISMCLVFSVIKLDLFRMFSILVSMELFRLIAFTLRMVTNKWLEKRI